MLEVEQPRAVRGRAPDVFRPGKWVPMRTYDENPISYNHVSRKWFVPLDAQLVKRARKDLEFMFGAAYGLVRDDPQFLWQLYTRVSVYF